MDEPSNERIIRIAEQKLFLTPNHSIPLNQTNIPPQSIRFRAGQEIFWIVAIVAYNEERAAIRMRVLEYHPTSVRAFYDQVMKKPIRFASFFELQWEQLEPLLSYYHKIDLFDVLANSKENETTATQSGIHHDPVVHGQVRPKQKEEEWTEQVQVDLLDVEIGIGQAHINVLSKWKAGPVRAVLTNSYLVPEYNWIKSFFAKALGTKKIHVILNWVKNIDGLSLSGVKSPELDKIDNRLIEVVRRLHFMNRWKDPTTPVDQSLFTSEELQEVPQESAQSSGKAPLLSDEDLLALLLDEFKVRNAAQLNYLAGKLQAKDHRLRFTLKPVAGFLFFIRGSQMTHHCWELLDSHATYLWSFNPSEVTIQEQFRLMEGIIGIIREQGRQQYKQHWRLQSNLNRGMVFRTIEHPHVSSHLKDGFPIWRQKIEEAIV